MPSHSQYILPQELALPPIKEAVFEIRFAAAKNSAANLLTAAPRLGVPEAHVSVADGAVRLRVGAPYLGWASHRERIDALLDALEREKLAGTVERISLKFVNLLEDLPPRQLDALRVELRVNGDPVPEFGLQLRMELSDERFVRIIEIQPGAMEGPVVAPGDAGGLLLSLECRRDIAGGDFWSQRADLLENLQFESRALFFRLVTRATIEKFGPIYRQPPQSE